MTSRPLRIGTRRSELALRQARMVQAALEQLGRASELVTFDTLGDQRLDQPLSTMGAKGIFTAELERALRLGEVDCCAHSLKDLPTDDPPGTEIVAVLPREDPRDVLVVRAGSACESVLDLPPGAAVGTSSLRRRAQLLALRPDVRVQELRGNVPTRLRKVDEGECDAAILAAAGLLRLGARDRIRAFLDAPAWLPAAGQGAVAIQALSADAGLCATLRALSHDPTMIATRAERSVLAALQGGCQVPIGALVVGTGADAVLHALVSDVDGTTVVRASAPLDERDPCGGGTRLAVELLRRGAGDILQALERGGRVPAPQPE